MEKFVKNYKKLKPLEGLLFNKETGSIGKHLCILRPLFLKMFQKRW